MIMTKSFELKFSGGRCFKVGIFDILGVAVDAVVNPANSGLSHGGGLAAAISDEAGPKLDCHCRQIVEKFGRIPVGQAVVSTAGRLPHKGVIHAVGPRMGDGDEQNKIAAAITQSLQRADNRRWKPVAFPAISTGLFMVKSSVCAEAFKAAVPAFWHANPDTSVQLVWLCLTVNHYGEFEKVLKNS
jgi:O-acetyl-ADP-ribose deacetylase (regulator of RNase III)